MLRAFA